MAVVRRLDVGGEVGVCRHGSSSGCQGQEATVSEGLPGDKSVIRARENRFPRPDSWVALVYVTSVPAGRYHANYLPLLGIQLVQACHH